MIDCSLLSCAMLLILFAIPGCNSVRRPSSSEKAAEPAPSGGLAKPHLAPGGAGRTAATAPPREEREREIREAMVGLLYDSEVAVVDPAVAPLIVPIPDPAQVDAELATAESALAQGAFADAIRALTRAVIHDPTRPEGFARLGAGLLDARQTRAAGAACRAALLRTPGDTPVRSRLAVIAQMLGAFSEATEAWREVLRTDAEHVSARGRLAVLLYYQELYEDAWTVIHEADELGFAVPPQLRVLLAAEYPEP